MLAAAISKVLSAKPATVLIAVFAVSIIGTLPAIAESRGLAHALVSKVTTPPSGWIEFCARQPDECAGATTAPRDPALSRQAWIDLVHVNRWVNETITPLSDLENWG